MKHIPILALAPVALLAACGSSDPEQVLETVRATEQAQIQALMDERSAHGTDRVKHRSGER